MSNIVEDAAVPQKQSNHRLLLLVVIVSVIAAVLMVGSSIFALYWISQLSSSNFSKLEMEVGQRAMMMPSLKEHLGTFELDSIKYDKKQTDFENFMQQKHVLAFKITGSLGEGYLLFEHDKDYGLGAYKGLVMGSMRYL
ncbi:MAG: hypothetical protein JNL67_13075 [Planctomycetaceae bacterium]|nr:hypothetical protein [Planctomycetaceae bacterium]